MMHEPEKSDAVVVAVKPANKAERSAAELVEPRTATKGNVDQQSTRRAQDRASVSQALERIRTAARQRKKARFTSLLHHVDPAMPSVPTMMRHLPPRKFSLEGVGASSRGNAQYADRALHGNRPGNGGRP